MSTVGILPAPVPHASGSVCLLRTVAPHGSNVYNPARIFLWPA